MELEKTIANKYPIISSSADPRNLSLSVKSLLLMLIPLAIYFAKGQGVELAEADLIELVGAITEFTASILLVYGLIRKIIIASKK